MKPIGWLLGVVVFVVLAGGIFIWCGVYNIAADDTHWPLTESLMATLRDRSIARQASDVVVPSLDQESLIREGAGNYDAMCVGCHLKPGMQRSEASTGLYPAPPNLSQHHTDDAARAFWVIKHGIKMSGMPAWGRSMEDDHIWGLVAFVRQLPGMSKEQYRELVASSGGHSHGGHEDEEHGMESAHHHDESQHEHKN